MRRLCIAIALTIAFMNSPHAWAQVDEVVVTGARISGDDYSSIPAVVLRRRADFIVQQIRLTNDTRLEEARIKELRQTIRDMVEDAAKKPGMALSYGEEFLIPVSATATEVVFGPGGKRPDTSAVNLYVKIALGEKGNVLSAIASLSTFIKNARITGRTEIDPEGEVGLSLVTPENYRYEIIGKITEDAKKLRETVGAKCQIQLAGLANRVSWQRSDVSELTLYIPYQMQLTECE